MIRAEIEEKSILAFVEKDEKTDDIGTLIKIEVKNKFSFKELETYIKKAFVYPSVTIELIDLVSLQKLDSKLSYLNIDIEKIALGEWRNIISNQIDIILAKREFCLSPYVQDKKLIGSIVLFSEGGRKKKELKTLLAGVTHKSIVKEKLKEIINDEKVTTNDIHNTIIQLSDDLDKRMREYPDFWKEIKNRSIANITNYEMLNVVLDENFDIVQIITDDIQDISKGRGILFIRSEVILPDLGIEWQSVNSFLYNSGKIVRNMLKLSRDDTNSIYDEDIISLKEIEDADYEMDNLYEDEENENYYEQVSRGNREIDVYDSEWTYFYDLLVAKKNNYIIGYGIESDRITSFIEENEETGWYDFFKNSRFPHEYNGENIKICSSGMYQDGIKIDLEPQMVLPLGVGWSIVNLTSRARFDLNVSRHEINNNREVIDEWMDTYGKIVQRIIVERCTSILKKMNLQYSIEDILADRKTGEYLEKRVFNVLETS